MSPPARARPGLRPPGRQRGAAILLAMLIMTLVATLAAGMVWLQWRGIEVESAERARGQADWLLNGATDWGKLILKSAARSNPNRVDLTQPWAMPLAESRLSSFLSQGSNKSADDGPDAFLSGQISDAQARYNLFNLYSPVEAAAGRLELQRLQILCDAIGVPSGTANTIYAGLTQSYSMVKAASSGTSGDSSANGASVLMPSRVSDLAWYGIDPAVVRQLEPYVVLLPQVTYINVNTAPAPDLMAAFPGLSQAGAQQIIQRRQQDPFNDAKGAYTAGGLSASTGTGPGYIGTANSSYFEIYGQLRYENQVLRERSLIDRSNLNQIKIILRERLSPDEQ